MAYDDCHNFIDWKSDYPKEIISQIETHYWQMYQNCLFGTFVKNSNVRVIHQNSIRGNELREV